MRHDREHLATLLTVVEEGTLDAAARRLRITPSAVSQRLRAFEEQVGRVLEGWDSTEVDDLRRLLERLNTSIEALEGRPWPRA